VKTALVLILWSIPFAQPDVQDLSASLGRPGLSALCHITPASFVVVTGEAQCSALVADLDDCDPWFNLDGPLLIQSNGLVPSPGTPRTRARLWSPLQSPILRC
jgi:hypothetical protein